MSEQQENYQYNFKFSEGPGIDKNLGKSIGVDTEFISATNNKLNTIFEGYAKDLKGSSPTGDYIKNLVESYEKDREEGVEREAVPIRDSMREFLKAAQSSPNSSQTFKQSELLETLTKNFTPEELALIAMGTVKKVVEDMARMQISKEVLKIVAYTNTVEEDKPKITAFLRLMQEFDSEDLKGKFLSSPLFLKIFLHYM